MKKNHVLQTLVMILFVFAASAQQGINYKAIISDAAGDVLVNTEVFVQFTILENGTTNVFTETHNSTTDANGIIIVNIGEGTVVNGDFTTINWGSNPHYLKTEINTGSGLIDMGTTEFKTVPYALYVQTANRAIIDEVDDADADPENELQTLTLVGGTLSLSNGGSVVLPSVTLNSGQYYFADKDRDGFGYMYEPIWVPDGVEPPAFYVNNSNDCNDNDFYAQDISPEQCDGIDNDCDGEIDEDWPLLGEPCTSGEGACLRYGFYVCNEVDPAGPPVCNAIPGVPQEEIDCNYLDDDCNGVVDDGYRDENGIYNSDMACGNCYTNCQEIYNRPNAFGRCESSGAEPVCLMICDPGYFDLDGIPQNGCEFFLDENAIYVSSDGEDFSGCGIDMSADGTINSCKTITYGIERAVSLGRKNVHVANGLYKETIYITDGISLLGGFDPVSWIRKVENTNSVISGIDYFNIHSVTLIAKNISQPTTISGFKIYGATNNNPLGNSYAIYIEDSYGGLVIRDNEIIGGVAGDGTDGINGGNGKNGQNGQNGFASKLLSNPTEANLGGWGGVLSTGTITLKGGNGGMSVAPKNNNEAESGRNGGFTSSLDGGLGGLGGHDRYTENGSLFFTGGFSAQAENGKDGLDGGNGQVNQVTADPFGTVINGSWTILPGGDGLKGSEGSSGGGGGGAGGADDRSFINLDVLGASGGGGGSGAEGGYGGIAGAAGGGTFCILILKGLPPVIENNSFYLGRSGSGGKGGNGGIKGIGGSGGLGGTIPVGIQYSYVLGSGGNGGKGGNGGHGSGGAGGTGGSSFGIYSFNMSGTANYETSNQFSGGIAGKGGSGGLSLGSLGLNGAEGIVKNTSYH